MCAYVEFAFRTRNSIFPPWKRWCCFRRTITRTVGRRIENGWAQSTCVCEVYAGVKSPILLPRAPRTSGRHFLEVLPFDCFDSVGRLRIQRTFRTLSTRARPLYSIKSGACRTVVAKRPRERFVINTRALFTGAQQCTPLTAFNTLSVPARLSADTFNRTLVARCPRPWSVT